MTAAVGCRSGEFVESVEMISVDTNVLARLYCDDPNDPEAARQRPAARRLLEQEPALFVPVTVVLELEWVMRGFYRLLPEDFARAMRLLLGLSNVVVEGWERVGRALELHMQGLDFADALHWSRSAHCRFVASFDDRGFARRIKRLALHPPALALDSSMSCVHESAALGFWNRVSELQGGI